MADKKAHDTHTRIATLLGDRKLKDALSELADALAYRNDPVLGDLLKKQEETYRYLIHYMVEGYADSDRTRMLGEIVSTLHFVNDSILRNEVITDSPDMYSSTLRFERVRKATVAGRLEECRNAGSLAALARESGGNAGIMHEADNALLSLFASVWTMFGASTHDYNALVETVKDPDVDFAVKAQIISALMLGNLRYFDRKGLAALLDIYDADVSPKLTARAIVAVLMVIAANPERVKAEPSLAARLSLWSDDILLYSRLREAVMAVIRARDTERISSKMKNEVLPELMKLKPEILNKLKDASEAADVDMLEVNPEWEEVLSKNGLGDKLKELTEMQMEGGDVMMMAFSNLKSFPFFNTVANWFLPFSSSHHEVNIGEGSDLSVFSRMLDMEGVMCDSDKYSFAFSLARMPEAQRKMMSERLGDQMEQLQQAIDEKRLQMPNPEFGAEVTRYVRDLYRFFKLFRRKEDFADPFAKPLDFESLPYVADVLADNEVVSLVGEFYFKRGYYAEALPLLTLVERNGAQSALMWEKIGYCHNALGDINRAMIWYRKAELLNPDSQWLVKKMALASRLQGDYATAAEYYQKALQSDPDNYRLLISTGNCLVEAGDYAAASGHYYHADYISPDRPSTWRAIAWAELMAGNTDKSLAYYDRLMESTACTPADHLNRGHALLVKHDLKNAAECYRRAARHHDFGIGKLEETLSADTRTLEKLGVDPAVLPLLLDKVKFDL